MRRRANSDAARYSDSERRTVRRFFPLVIIVVLFTAWYEWNDVKRLRRGPMDESPGVPIAGGA